MNDYIIRATAANDQIRAFAAVTTEMVETAREHHNTSPVATAALGRLLTAGAMMGSMMKGEKRCSDPSDQGRRSPSGNYGNCRFPGKCKGVCRKSRCLHSGKFQREAGRCRSSWSWIPDCD